MAPKADPALTVSYFDRSYNDYATMGYNGEEALAEDEKERKEKAAAAEKDLR
jgi:hypothetical protein